MEKDAARPGLAISRFSHAQPDNQKGLELDQLKQQK